MKNLIIVICILSLPLATSFKSEKLLQFKENRENLDQESLSIIIDRCKNVNEKSICYGNKKGSNSQFVIVRGTNNYQDQIDIFFIGSIDSNLRYNSGTLVNDGRDYFALSFEDEFNVSQDKNDSIIRLWYYHDELTQLVELDAKLYRRVNEGYELY